MWARPPLLRGFASLHFTLLLVGRASDIEREREERERERRGREREGRGEKGCAYWFVLSPNTLDYIVLGTYLVFHSFCDVT